MDKQLDSIINNDDFSLEEKAGMIVSRNIDTGSSSGALISDKKFKSLIKGFSLL